MEEYTSALGLLTDWLVCPHNALIYPISTVYPVFNYQAEFILKFTQPIKNII